MTKKNYIKHLCMFFLMFLLMLSAFSQSSVSNTTTKKNGVIAATEPINYIYFDLAAGMVEITKTTYSGYIYVCGVETKVSGPHLATNHYYVYQSNTSDPNSDYYITKTGYVTNTDYIDKTNFKIPQYPRVRYTAGGENKTWNNYITNNIDVKGVSLAWDDAAADAHRNPTKNYIRFSQESEYAADLTIDNIWSNYYQASVSRTTGGIAVHLDNKKNTTINLKLKGDNRVGCVHYSSDRGSGNQIIFSDSKIEDTPGSITVADFSTDWKANHWNAAIGAADNPANEGDMSEGIVIKSGYIFAGTTPEDNCTAIGGGGNNYGSVTIDGGTVTAVVSSTGTAIGGGIGYGAKGGDTDVTINGGTIYAYNLGIVNSKDKPAGVGVVDAFAEFVPAAAIGGGGSNGAAGSLTTNITITGGTIYAQSLGGAAIGGGCSANSDGGPANITITGGTIIAKSVGGIYGTKEGSPKILPAVSIGGGTGKTAGGSVNLSISGKDTIVRTGSIGGGLATGEGAKIGSANVEISGGNIIGQVIMAGGAANPCSFIMTDGIIHSTDVINGVTIGAANSTGVTITDPNPSVPISFYKQDGDEQNGGAVFMNDPTGVAIITGGLIGNCTAHKGGAIYMSGGTFILSGDGELGTNHAKDSGGSVYVGGGTVQIGGTVTLKDGTVLVSEDKASNCAIRNSDAVLNGGGVYVIGTSDQTGATVTINGGAIHNNTAGNDGGGMYISQGKVDVYGGSFYNNIAENDGGGIYVSGDVHMMAGSITGNKAKNNGGGFCVEDGIVLMYGGNIENNSAAESGGGLHISAITKSSAVDILSGSISGNQAKTGGGVSVISADNLVIHVSVGVNCIHPNLNTENRTFTPFLYPSTAAACGDAHDGHEHPHITEESIKTHSNCPQINNNVALSNGGGFYLQSEKSYLVFYCVIEDGNIANGNKQCYDMDVKGGHVQIGDNSYDPEGIQEVRGNIIMKDSILIEAGTVDIYGTMDNPKFTTSIIVDIEKHTDYFWDHRIVKVDNPSEGLPFYKVHYYENFKNAGKYIAEQYPDEAHKNDATDHKYDFTVLASLFQNPGYKIVRWNTKPDGSGTDYDINETYNLKELYLQSNHNLGGVDHNGNSDPSLLIIYAIWEEKGYVLNFNPNVGVGQSYTGTMENQRVTVGLLDGTQTIQLNQFKRNGLEFLGWTLTASPSETDTVYTDGQAITVDFTQEDGATIVLYAKWSICNHLGHLIYKVNDGEKNVMVESCPICNGHSATAIISAINSIYNGNTHLATINYSNDWLGSKELGIVYTMKANAEWDAKDTIDDNWSADSKPVHAGEYIAKFSVTFTTIDEITQENIEATATAQVEYTISPIQWETPDVPVIKFSVQKDTTSGNYNSIITITSPTGTNIMYLITQLDKDSNSEIPVESHKNWQASTDFSNIPFGIYYYFYAKRIADRDHLESEQSKSTAYLTTGGNVIYIESGIGIKVVPGYGSGVFQYTVSAAEGYHLRGYVDNLTSDNMTIGPSNTPSFIKPIEGVEGSDAYLQDGGIVITRTTTDGGYNYVVTLVDGKVAFHQITLEFNGAVKNASVTHKGTDGQEFGDFNDKPIVVSSDSAFTIKFALGDFIPDEYNVPVLSFTHALPVGSTVIMKVNGNYYHYKVTTATTSIDLSEFTAMGKNETFSCDTTSSESKAVTYQFIVDFSQTSDTTITSHLDVNVNLDLIAKSTSAAPNIPADGTTHISLSIQPKASFILGTTSTSEKTTILNGTYTPSLGAASIWQGKHNALVLTAPINAPADLTITVVVGGTTTIYKMNENRKFIIPLGEIGTKEIKITMNSKLFGSTETTYEFDAEWYVTSSSTAPLNGQCVAQTGNFNVSCKKDAMPSIRIDGSTHLLHALETLNLTVNYVNMPTNATITAYLQGKSETGEYVDMGLSRPVLSNENGDGGTTLAVPTEVSNTVINIPMGRMDTGSYRIAVIATVNGQTILEVDYYFVIA